MIMGRVMVPLAALLGFLVLESDGAFLSPLSGSSNHHHNKPFSVDRRPQSSPLFSYRSREQAEQQKTTVTTSRVDIFQFRPAFIPSHAVDDAQEKLLNAKQEQEERIQKLQTEQCAALKQAKEEYEESAAAWDRKIRQMADVLEQQREISNQQELELQVVKDELVSKKSQINSLEVACAELEAQVNVSKAVMEELESTRREQSLRIKELEYDVEYTEDQYSQETRIVRMRDARIRDLEQGIMDAAGVAAQMNATITYLQSRVAELEAQVEDLNDRVAQSRAAEERLRREIMAATDRYQSEFTTMEEMKADLANQLREAQYSIKDLTDSVTEKEQMITAQETAIAAADRSIVALQTQLAADKDEYEALQQQLSEIHGEYYQALSEMETIKKDKAQNAARIELLLAEAHSERQMRVKEAEVWRTAVEVAENSRRAAEKTVDALDARIKAMEEMERDRSVVIQERKEVAMGRWGKLVRRGAVLLGVAGLGAAPGMPWWETTVNTALDTVERALGGRFSVKGRLARVIAGVVFAAVLAMLGKSGRPLMQRGTTPEPPKLWNTNGSFFSTKL